MSATRLALPACAKINLWLRVFGRDARGFHAIETLFQLISIADELVVERTGSGVTLAGAPEGLGPTRDNLIVKAAQRFLRVSKVTGGAAILLHKTIPWAAGLGGGSSDAAATLVALNRLYGRPLTDADLMTLGAELGSDVPFFMSGAAMALGWERGERLLALPPLPSRPLLVVPPAAPVKTSSAYAWIDQDRGVEHTGEFATVVPIAALTEWEQVRSHSHNDFESAVAARLPEIGHWLDRLRETDAFLVRLAGSGGAAFALFETVRARDAAWQRLGADPRVLRGETLTAVPAMKED
ncbi:MAG: 4-(cytidine 5'-diphospho)-2-C-methyl-D-erythritol kinase [Gemmatimonadales bacterium]